MFKKNYIEVCFTTEDGVQHLRLHGYLKRNDIPVKTEQIFGSDYQFTITKLNNMSSYKEKFKIQNFNLS